MNKQKGYEIFSRLKQHNPRPTTELNYKTSFELLIAVILSAQATDKGVNKAKEDAKQQIGGADVNQVRY